LPPNRDEIGARLICLPPMEEIRKAAGAGPVTLFYAARNEPHSHAVILKEVLTGASAES
jgi:uncharacterized protein YeaO (DUF488 family)